MPVCGLVGTMPPAKGVTTKVVDAAAKAISKELNKPTNVVFTKVVPVSPALKKFLGVGETNRTDAMKKVWGYVKENDLQDPANRRDILCDENLKQVMGKDRVNFTEVARLLNPHFPPKAEKKK